MKKTERYRQTIRLAGFGRFEDLQYIIRPAVFGWMVKEANQMLVEYHSDLYHDALSLDEIQGEWRGHWFVRPYGTWLGPMAAEARKQGKTEGRHYYLRIYEVDGLWHLDVTRTDFEPVPDETVDDRGRRVGSDYK